MPPLKILKEKKVLVIEITIAILILIGGYYFVSVLQQGNAIVTKKSTEQNLPEELVLFLNVTNGKKPDLKLDDLFGKTFVQKLHDFSIQIGQETTRRRDDPFTP